MHVSSCGLGVDALNGAAKGDGETDDADATGVDEQVNSSEGLVVEKSVIYEESRLKNI